MLLAFYGLFCWCAAYSWVCVLEPSNCQVLQGSYADFHSHSSNSHTREKPGVREEGKGGDEHMAYNTSAFNRLVGRRPSYVRRFLQAGATVLYRYESHLFVQSHSKQQRACIWSFIGLYFREEVKVVHLLVAAVFVDAVTWTWCG